MQPKQYTGIMLIILLFVCANLAFLSFYSDVWWDSSVYIGMAKYIFSNGESGLWEESRPLIFPLILSTGYNLDINIVYFGRIISVLFAAIVVLVTYIIGKRLFSVKSALIAAFFVAFSYTFLFFSPNILTEIPSTLLVLLAFYSFLHNRFFLMGFFSGIAIMTRLFQVFALVGLAIVFLIYFFRKPNFTKKLLYVALGVLLLIIPYMLLNYYLYTDIFLPFKVQSHLTKTTGWTHYEEYGFYLKGLFKENFFVVFLLFLPFLIKRNHKFYALLMIPLAYIVIFSLVQHKEMRFMISILPFIYLLASYCLVRVYEKLGFKKLASAVFFAMAIFWLSLTFSGFKDAIAYQQQRNDDGLLYLQDYIKHNSGTIWITSPLYALYSDAKIDGLLYFYSSENLINFIDENKNKVDLVLFNNCDMQCSPVDSLCPESRKILSEALSKLKKIYEKEIGSCKYQIFRSIS